MKKSSFIPAIFFLLFISLFAASAMADEPADQASAAERGRSALIATGHSSLLHFPEEEDYLTEWKTLYARKAFFPLPAGKERTGYVFRRLARHALPV